VVAMMSGWAVGWMWVWPLLIVAGLLIIGYLVLRLVQDARLPTARSDPVASTARRILDERFARGEISEDEYQRRREVLS
jgi:putative membrane protein